jgi:hypothetical protein
MKKLMKEQEKIRAKKNKGIHITDWERAVLKFNAVMK